MSSTDSERTTTHLAMWSGPRNISTALMRSFESRGHTKVCDEPLYSHYLATTGLDHPVASQIIATHERDWRKVVSELTAPLDEGTTLYYQKHMSHHLIPEVGREWIDTIDHAFLIRDPAEMLISLNKVIPMPRVEDTGLPQQLELYRSLREAGSKPPVIDSKDVLDDPAGVLPSLCRALNIEYRDSMLSWPAGTRETDGCWADHWYANVFKTTAFGTWRERSEEVPNELTEVLSTCQEIYDELRADRIQAN
ncbi:MAG: hypothetical protein ACI835_000709 [Planctomycetota bacterium]|jgi:hypothetical protein